MRLHQDREKRPTDPLDSFVPLDPRDCPEPPGRQASEKRTPSSPSRRRRPVYNRPVPPHPPIPFSAIPTLSALTAEDRQALAPLCELRAYEKGETVFSEGEPADRILFLFVGRVKIVKAGPERDLIIEILDPGEPVGTVAVFEGRPYPASAIAIEPSGVVSIPAPEFFALLEKRPAIARRLLAGLTLRLMAVNRRIADMTGSVEYRAARLFITLSARMGKPRGDAIFVPLALSRQEIAELLGTTVETAIRIMSRWQKEGLVETDKTGFLIRNVHALHEIAPED
jgi:CRP/FNR family transcriptional regulator, nitrogen oxide reductase regulator